MSDAFASVSRSAANTLALSVGNHGEDAYPCVNGDNTGNRY